MAKVSGRPRGGLDVEETGGALSGLLAEEDEFDRRALWRLGTWAAVSVGAVIVALLANQSSTGIRHEQNASADLLKQAQQLQLTARESQNETRRLASAIDTLNSDRDRLYSRVAVIEQGLDSVTGAIARQGSASPSAPTGASQVSSTTQLSSSQANANPPTASATPPAGVSANTPGTAPPAANPAPTASVTPAATAPVDPPAAKPSPAPPVVGPVAATVPAVVEKQDKQLIASTASEPPSAAAKSAAVPPSASAQSSGSLVTSKSMMSPPDPAAGKLIEPAVPPKAVTSTPMPEVAAVAPKAPAETKSELASTAPELTVQRTEFGVDVGGANSISGLRALWRGLIKSKANAALTKLRPIIVIKENTNGLGMQLRLVAGPITDAAAAAKICASLTVSDRNCSTAVFEGQRLAVSTDEADKIESGKAESEPDNKPALAGSKSSGHRHYYAGRHPKIEEPPPPPPKPEPSTLSSMIFGKRKQD